MVSEQGADETDGVGEDPDEEGALDIDPRDSLETGRGIEGDSNQDAYSYRDQCHDVRMKFLEVKVMTRTRTVEERFGS